MLKLRLVVSLMVMELCCGLAIAAPVAGGACENLRAVHVDGMTVTLAERVAAGAQAKYPKLPAFCRVAATFRPTSDSVIKFEVWMPEGAAWNGKYKGTGNG